MLRKARLPQRSAQRSPTPQQPIANPTALRHNLSGCVQTLQTAWLLDDDKDWVLARNFRIAVDDFVEALLQILVHGIKTSLVSSRRDRKRAKLVRLWALLKKMNPTMAADVAQGQPEDPTVLCNGWARASLMMPTLTVSIFEAAKMHEEFYNPDACVRQPYVAEEVIEALQGVSHMLNTPCKNVPVQVPEMFQEPSAGTQNEEEESEFADFVQVDHDAWAPLAAAEVRTWKQRAGRTQGDDGYQFGDFSRWLFYNGGQDEEEITWKSRAGRSDGDEGYQFGDLSRTLCQMTLRGLACHTCPDSDSEMEGDDE